MLRSNKHRFDRYQVLDWISDLANYALVFDSMQALPTSALMTRHWTSTSGPSELSLRYPAVRNLGQWAKAWPSIAITGVKCKLRQVKRWAVNRKPRKPVVLQITIPVFLIRLQCSANADWNNIEPGNSRASIRGKTAGSTITFLD